MTSALAVLHLVLLVPAVIACGLALWLGLQVALACLGPREPAQPLAAERPALAVLVPAHNEQLGIVATVQGLRAQLLEGDRLLVVADNCSDATATLAREAGAEVLERQHATLRGKGYALDAGVRHLQQTGPRDVVVLVDADCSLAAGSLERLGKACAVSSRPAQALYLMQQPRPADGGPIRVGGQLAEFAWRVKNWVRPLGLARLGLPCPLFGTGMAFPWAVIVEAPLASGHLVEDMQLGVDLILRGRAPLFVPQARVLSQFASSDQGQQAQRTRWEHGHLDTLLHGVPRLVGRALRRGDVQALAMAVDLAVPPLALLVLVLGAATALGLALWATAGFAGAALVSLLGLAAVALAVGGAWAGFGRDLLAARTLLAAPWYALRKLALYARFVVARQTQWVRSQRDGER